MASQLQQAIEFLRSKALNDAELGASFENLVKVFLENDATQIQEYEKVWRYPEWAKDRLGYSQKDIGIDLVAELRDGSGFCAIQCKCYQPNHTISKADLDSFISAASTNDFSRLLLVDTSIQDIGRNAQNVLENLDKDYIRLQLEELEQSRIDWLTYVREDRVRLYSKKELREHQAKALHAVTEGLAQADRGKLIMACGTGKTFTSLRISEQMAGRARLVLYMVPSLALMSQTVREWKNDAIEDFNAFSACSDVKVGKRNDQDDQVIVNLHDLAFPATTEPAKLADQIAKANSEKMTVVFSTYHSIDVIHRAQYDHGLRAFDLIICDEAHRTTGATLVGDDESSFVRIHKNENVKGAKRLYMTATPRIFGEKAKSKAGDENIALASMDDEDIFGKILFHRGFGWAVENNLLTDYKVVILAVDEGTVSDNVQKRLAEGSELKLDDATKIIGCYKALGKVGFADKIKSDDQLRLAPMRRALAFCQNIALSKMFEAEFSRVVDEYVSNEERDRQKDTLKVQIRHVDGTFNAEQRNERLIWLKDGTDENICRVLTNARCLSEGVDVPTLDAIMFLHPRKSQIDVVQSVGRVMRKSEEKDLGYVILPITVAPGISPEKALNDNDKYRVVWQILNALRAHDERFDSTINRIGLGEDVSDRIEIIGVGSREELDATTAVVEDIKAKKKEKDEGENDDDVAGDDGNEDAESQEKQSSFVMGDLSQAIKAKIVEKCGTRDYWENWASDIARIAQAHITRIQTIVFNEGTVEKAAFKAFVEEIRDDLNPEISETDAVEMLAQHLITKPVFDTLFQGNQFTVENPVSKAMQTVLNALYKHNIEKEADTLEKFYSSVKRRAADIITATGRQHLVLELYDRFFRNAFPALTQKMGIVYTPVEVVDFIIRSIGDVLRDEFGQTLSSKNVHILDPFTGTGTFITRLMQSGLIENDDLPYKYKNEIHANEVVLLAYYIAAINIEAVYQELMKESQYQPFNGIVLTDTFQMYEQASDMVANLLPDNFNRRKNQKAKRITAIIGNPPYSAGQKSANDNAANISYPNLDKRIEKTYAAASEATLKRSLYDSYIRAFRWASDRIGDEGVVSFVSGAAWIDRRFADGLRKHLREDFTKVYVFHLRGDIRKNMLSKGLAREGENIFGQGSMTGICITVLVRNPAAGEHKILFYDIGDDLKREQKLALIKHFKSINGITAAKKWMDLSPDENNDWVNQGEKEFQEFISLGDKKTKNARAIFRNYSNGLKTNRDAWNYNCCLEKVKSNVSSTIMFYNLEVDRYANHASSKSGEKKLDINAFINKDPKLISWDRTEREGVANGRKVEFFGDAIQQSLYRPFSKRWAYTNSKFNNCVYQLPQLFPKQASYNRVIAVTGIGSRSGFSALMSDRLPDVQLMANAQCFPLKLYEKQKALEGLFAKNSDSTIVSDGISDHGLEHFQKAYPDTQITKEDVFYYVYGLLHSPDYSRRFQNNLSKEMPRIPTVKNYEEFKTYSDAGRKLGDLHVNFEKVDCYPATFKEGDLRLAKISDEKSFYRVRRMRFFGTRGKIDKSVVIPLAAYNYVVNGKSALDWVMERQSVKTDKDSGIVNDANDYANEAMNNPAYPLELFQRVITVSLETMKIVSALPSLDID